MNKNDNDVVTVTMTRKQARAIGVALTTQWKTMSVFRTPSWWPSFVNTFKALGDINRDDLQNGPVDTNLVTLK